MGIRAGFKWLKPPFFRTDGQKLAIARPAATLFSAIGVALFPKCPACVAAYGSFFGIMGLGLSSSAVWLWPLLAVLMMVGVGSMMIRARRRHGFGPALLGAFVAVFLLINHYQYNRPWQSFGGILLLGIALVWNQWPKTIRPSSPDGSDSLPRTHCS